MLNVLIVDDEPYIREGLKVLIDWEKEGFSIKGEAKNAFEAIELVQQEHYDLMFIDIKMPKMNGIELSRFIREQLHKRIEFIFLTGFLDIEYINAAFQLRAIQYLQKPILPDQLINLLKSIRKGLEQKNSEESTKNRSHVDLLEYYLLEISNGIRSEENLRFLRKLFRGEKTIHYVKLSFFGNEIDEANLFNEQFNSLKMKCKNHIANHPYYVITQIGSLFENALGLIITGSMLAENRVSIYEMVDRMLRDLSEVTVLKVVARVGKAVNDISKLNESYKDCIESNPYSLHNKDIPLEIRLNTYLHAHYMENITLKSLSEQFYVNTAYLGQFFKKHNGVLLKEYLNSIRVQKAAQLLESSSLKIYQIADKVGFQSADSFITSFSKEMGVTPQKYRMLHLEK